jgi:Mg2+ and Co2+ transporter CorA
MANIVLPFVTTYDDKGAKKADLSLKGLMKTQLGMGVSAAAVAQQIGKAVKAFAEDEAQQKQLSLAVRNSTGASEAQVAAIEDTISKMQFQKAVSDGELRPSLATLVRATGDVTKAQSLMNLALDISAGTGKDLQAVSLALAKAQGGNVTALTRLGVSLDANAVKTKDFDAITRELGYTFQGAADAAANSAEGGFKKLQIATDELYETVGGKLAPVLGDYATAASKIAEATIGAEGKTKGWSNRIFELVTRVLPATQQIGFLNNAVKGYADTAGAAVTETRNLSRQFRAFEGQMMSAYENGLKPTKEELAALARTQDTARKKAKDYAETLRDRVGTALQTIKDKVKSAQDAYDSFRDSQAESITGFVSLSEAVKTQKDAEDELSDALKTRAQAYTDLAKIDPAAQADDYANALERVAQAESDVASASTKRSKSNYLTVFQKQIEDAKKFASNLGHLINAGLGQAGLAQLINLGPEAGVEVTDHMIAVPNAGAVTQLNQDLAGLASSATSFGNIGAGAFLGGNLAGAQATQGTVNQISIQVNAGLVSNPAQVGRDIIEAIKSAERLSGQVFVSA